MELLTEPVLLHDITVQALTRDLRVLVQVLLSIDYVPPLIPVDKPNHVNRLLCKVILEMLIKCVMSPLVCQIILAQLIVTINQFIIATFRRFLLFESLFALKMLVELRLCVDIHLLIEIF